MQNIDTFGIGYMAVSCGDVIFVTVFSVAVEGLQMWKLLCTMFMIFLLSNTVFGI